MTDDVKIKIYRMIDTVKINRRLLYMDAEKYTVTNAKTIPIGPQKLAVIIRLQSPDTTIPVGYYCELITTTEGYPHINKEALYCMFEKIEITPVAKKMFEDRLRPVVRQITRSIFSE